MKQGSSNLRRIRGFTLIELVMSLAVTSILLAAMGSAMVIAFRSLESEKGPASQTIAASDAMQEMARDVSMAIAFTTRTAPGVTPVVLQFTVPDRNGDLVPESIRYEWSGTPGAPLTRSYNGGAAENVAEDVRELSLSYLTRFRKSG